MWPDMREHSDTELLDALDRNRMRWGHPPEDGVPYVYLDSRSNMREAGRAILAEEAAALPGEKERTRACELAKRAWTRPTGVQLGVQLNEMENAINAAVTAARGGGAK